MAEINNKYDYIGEFYQGVAIVIKNDKYGAIMIGGKEIVPPIYEELSEFKDGYAVAKWNSEERIVNLSGQIRVSKDDKEIYLPEEYDWGFDFIEDICVVVKNDKYGIIDSHFNVKLECEYDSFSNYHNGYGVFSKYRESKWSDDVWVDNFLIDNNGKVQYKIKESFEDGHKIVCCVDGQQKSYGVMDSNMQIIIHVKYSQMNRLKSGFYVADLTGNTKLFFQPTKGNLICEKEVDNAYDYLKDLNQDFFVIYQQDKTKKEWKTSIYSSPESLQLSFSSQVPVESDRDGSIIFEYSKNKFKYDSDGNLYIVSTRYVSYPGHWETNIVRKVKKEYLNFIHKPFPVTSHNNKYEIIINKANIIDEQVVSKYNMVDVEDNLYNNIKLEEETYNNYLKLKENLLQKGYYINIRSGFRTFNDSKNLYNYYSSKKGKAYAEKYVATAGTSEHNVGLAFDFIISTNKNSYVMDYDSDEYFYLENICYLYGFIIRYPRDKEQITGYSYEPWHLRYVGNDLAKYLKKNNLTLEEYYK